VGRKVQAIRGMNDILPTQSPLWQKVEAVLRSSVSAYGYSERYDREGNELAKPTKMTESTLFDLASNTKMYATNYAVMKLVSDNRLNVNLPISHYLPEYRGEGRESRLVKDLLNHSAGYQPAVDFHRQDNNLGTRFYSQQKSKTQQLLIKSVPFKTGRNLASVYSDVDYMLLGTLIERITHMPLDEFVESSLYRPLGLKNTLFNPLKKGFNLSQIAATELQGNSRQSSIEFENIRTDVVHGEVHDEKAFYSMQGVAGHAGLFSNDDKLSNQLIEAGNKVDEKLWRMPLHKNFDKLIDSKNADMQNINYVGGAGSTTAAQFLQRFILNKTPWAHLDIAGMAFSKYGGALNSGGATGYGVRLLNQLIEDNYE